MPKVVKNEYKHYGNLTVLTVDGINGVFPVLIDTDDYELISQFKWAISVQKNGNSIYFYAGASVNIGNNKKKTMRMTQAILGYPLDGFEVDHIDQNSLNNKRNNLRIVSSGFNKLNKSINGYHWVTEKKKWRASIKFEGITTHIGYYNSKEEARMAYLIARKELTGMEFNEGQQ